MTTGIVYHDQYLLHEQSPTHPERRERLSYTRDQFLEEGICDRKEYVRITPCPAPLPAVLAVHDLQYISFLEQSSEKGGYIDADTSIPKGLFNSARLAAGGAIAAADAVLDNQVKNAFALCRPPGHHAGKGHGAGFCYLNNIAIMVRHLQARGMKRIVILDWDAHHGNGTQEIFYDDPSVLFISIHQYPFYPGTGSIYETGSGTGIGFTINMPIPAGTSNESYYYFFDEIIHPIVCEFSPDCIAISAGQDTHFTDPLTSLAVTATGYANLMQKTCELSERLCDGRLVAVLEGGYSVEGGLPYTNLAILAAMAGLDTSHMKEPSIFHTAFERRYDPHSFENVVSMARTLKGILCTFWQSIPFT